MTIENYKTVRSSAFLNMYSQELSHYQKVGLSNTINLNDKREAIRFILYVLRNKVEQNEKCIALQRKYERVIMSINKKISIPKNNIQYE